MQWEAEALVLAARPNGESSAIVDVFTSPSLTLLCHCFKTHAP